MSEGMGSLHCLSYRCFWEWREPACTLDERVRGDGGRTPTTARLPREQGGGVVVDDKNGGSHRGGEDDLSMDDQEPLNAQERR